LDETTHLVADNILAKHDEKYTPPLSNAGS